MLKKKIWSINKVSLFEDGDEEWEDLLAGAQVTQFAGSKQESNFTDN